jgi:hypothetical protein
MLALLQHALLAVHRYLMGAYSGWVPLVCLFRLEDHDELQGEECLQRFDRRLAAAVHALKEGGRWEALVQAGGSSERILAASPTGPLDAEACPACACAWACRGSFMHAAALQALCLLRTVNKTDHGKLIHAMGRLSLHPHHHAPPLTPGVINRF